MLPMRSQRSLDNLFKHLWHHYGANGSDGSQIRITECGKETRSDNHCDVEPAWPMSDKRPLKGWQAKAVKIVANKTNFD